MKHNLFNIEKTFSNKWQHKNEHLINGRLNKDIPNNNGIKSLAIKTNKSTSEVDNCRLHKKDNLNMKYYQIPLKTSLTIPVIPSKA